jgi:hypothetical protein
MAKTESKEIGVLEARITSAMKSISTGEKHPPETGIGKMFSELRVLDEASHKNMLQLYMPISKAYGERPDVIAAKAKAKKLEDEQRKLHLDSIHIASTGGISDDDIGRPTRTAKEAKSKVKKEPKVRVPKVKGPAKEKGNRDRTAYMFNGEEYGKGGLVRAVVREYVKANPKISFDMLKKVFPDTLMKSYGVFQTYEKATEASKVRRRYFLKDDQLIKLSGPVKLIAVCDQWSAATIPAFLSCAKLLGYKIS